MKAHLKNNFHKEVETFVFNVKDKNALSQFEWEGDDEFSYKGEMFDVLEKHKEGNKLIIRCISDTKETSLLKDFKKANNNQSSPKAKLIYKLLDTHFISSTNSTCINFYREINPVKVIFNSPVNAGVKTILTPPPDMA